MLEGVWSRSTFSLISFLCNLLPWLYFFGLSVISNHAFTTCFL
jgi:hypothetical protein